MSAMSDYLELKFLDHFTGTASTSAPSAVYLGLSTASLQDDASGTELTGNNYSRKAITFASASSGSIANNNSDFPDHASKENNKFVEAINIPETNIALITPERIANKPPSKVNITVVIQPNVLE